MQRRLLVLFLLLPLISLADLNSITQQGEKTLNQQPITVNSKGIITPKAIVETNLQKYYSLKISYPQLIGNANDPSVQGFNQAVLAIIAAQRDAFFKKLPATLAFIKQHGTAGMPPLSTQSNYLQIAYEIKSVQNNIISVRFTSSTYSYAEAHPTSSTQTLNYDLSSQRALNLKDLFKPDSNYLQTISNYSQQVLVSRLMKNVPKTMEEFQLNWIRKGTAPSPQNYENWNIVPQGLLISFDTYQVAAYVYGRQEVVVPWNEFKDLQIAIPLKAELAKGNNDIS